MLNRAEFVENAFGVDFPMTLEPTIYTIASSLSNEYKGGYWNFYQLSNGGFYMAPDDDSHYQVTSPNGYEGQLSGDALGMVACLFTYSYISFSQEAFLADICAKHFHWLRDYAIRHKESKAILRAID